MQDISNYKKPKNTEKSPRYFAQMQSPQEHGMPCSHGYVDKTVKIDDNDRIVWAVNNN